MNNYILVTGGSGMVGSRMPENYLKPSHIEFDINDYDNMIRYCKNHNISRIIHLAALNLRDCENNHVNAISTNIGGTTNICRLAKTLDVPLIYVSTGAVFSTNTCNVHYNNDSCNPNTIYGITKSISEEICKLYSKAVIVRTGWLFGGIQKSHNKFVELCINNILTNTTVRASNDFYGSPTYVDDFVKELINIDHSESILHIVNEGYASGYEIAMYICEILGGKGELVHAVKCTEVPNSGPYRGNSEKLNSTCGLRHWKDALREYVVKYCNEKKLNIEVKTPVLRYRNRTVCRLCDYGNLSIVLKLTATPPANHFVTECVYQECIPLTIVKCLKCSHHQLLEIVEPEYLFRNYPYISSTSKSMSMHLQSSVLEISRGLRKNSNILEIGANDGTALIALKNAGYTNIIGVDPSPVNLYDVPIIEDYYNGNFKIDRKFDLIYGFHCCAHIEDIYGVFSKTHEILVDGGLFVIEVGYLLDVYNKKSFDVIYHEHIDYYTITSLRQLCKRIGFIIVNIVRSNIQGGSIRVHMRKGKDIIPACVSNYLEMEKSIDLSNWNCTIDKIGRDINILLKGLSSYNIVGYGAPAKVTTFLYKFGINKSMIRYIIDDNPLKQYKYTPGLHIPVLPYNPNDKIDYIIIFAWNFAEEIIQKIKNIGCRIIVPFPEIRII